MTEVMLVGEAWGEKEAEVRRPFVGASGWLLNQMLAHAGLSRDACYTTNVFNLRPPGGNDVKNLCGIKYEGIPGMPELVKGKYVQAKYAPEIERLYEEIRSVNPNIIVALGATASWALLHSRGIKEVRGAIAPTAPAVTQRLDRVYKVLPTYHPAMILRDYSARPIATADLQKAAREASFPEVRRPERFIWVEPSLDDLHRFEQKHMAGAELVACDVETKGNLITCIGFAPDPQHAIVVPFFSDTPPFANYWPTTADEVTAWTIVRDWLGRYRCIFQNGLFDMKMLWRHHHIPLRHDIEDTMLMHHAYMPELPKGLGFLATLYTDEASWKFMRKGLKHD